MIKHFGRYEFTAWWEDRYRVCLICGRVTRNYGRVPLIHNGRKARR